MNLKTFYLSFILLFLFYGQPSAQTSPEWDAARIRQKMDQLNTLGTVLYLAAHPDDENTRLIAYLVNGKHYRTGYLALTRGDGGQNLIGTEQGPALGLIRTQELLAARHNDGALQFFTRANDFGYVKNPKETFKIWNKDSLLSDVVLTIRRFRPDVIVLRFPTTGEGGHGHHTASAILGVEAFDAAADSSKFSWQLKLPGVHVWQAKRLFWNTFQFGSVNTTSPKQLQIDVGGYNPLLGKSYGEISAESRSMHKSQGFGVKKHRGSQIEYFKLLKGSKVDHADSSLMTYINTSWTRLPNTKEIQSSIQHLLANYQPLHPERSLGTLLQVYTSLKSWQGNDPQINYWKKIKLAEVKQLILACSGVWMEATANDYSSVPGGKAEITASIIARNPSSVQLQSITFQKHAWLGKEISLPFNKMYRITKKVVIPKSTPYSDPYWLKHPHSNAMYTVNNPRLIGQSVNDPEENVYFHLTINGILLVYKRPVVFKSVDPVRGEVYRPFEILPPVTVNISNSVFVFNDTTPKPVTFTIQANRPDFHGTLQIHVPEGWKVQLKNPNINLTKKYEVTEVKALISPSQQGKNGNLTPIVSSEGKKYHKSIVRIEYPHIPYQFFLKDASAKVVHLDLVKKGGNNIGYIPGAGDKIPAALRQIGYNVTLLTNDVLKKEDLSQFTAIVTGVRAYNVNMELANYYTKLMEYIKNGGNLIVQYNTNSRLGPIKQKIGPYPFSISRNRVTDETAEVKFIDPSSPIVTSPNKITSKDFEGWIQERGTYFAVDLDKHYQTVFSMHDAGENPHKGSLIYAKYGKGYFIYTGLVFFRELPAGVPGAYRLFENLISLGK